LWKTIIQGILVFGCTYWRTDEPCSATTTLRRRRDECISAGIMDTLQGLVLEAYDRIIGLELNDIVVDGCSIKASCGDGRVGKSLVDRGKQGTKRSTVVDVDGIPLGDIAAPADHHDSPCRITVLKVLGGF
jgi:hypothetical protein